MSSDDTNVQGPYGLNDNATRKQRSRTVDREATKEA